MLSKYAGDRKETSKMYTTKGSIMVELMDIGMEKIQQAGSLEGIGYRLDGDIRRRASALCCFSSARENFL